MSLYNILLDELKDYNIGAFDANEQRRRIAICQTCTQYTGDETHECKVCKCNINLKVMMTDNSCPSGKWVVERTS